MGKYNMFKNFRLKLKTYFRKTEWVNPPPQPLAFNNQQFQSNLFKCDNHPPPLLQNPKPFIVNKQIQKPKKDDFFNQMFNFHQIKQISYVDLHKSIEKLGRNRITIF